jgi:hypothetical protein
MAVIGATPVKKISKEKMPPVLRVDSYFDLEAYPSIHAELLTGEEIKSVLDVVAGIGAYAKKWITDTINEKIAAGAAKRVCCEGLAGVQTLGKFEVYVEEGAVFQPANIWGVTADDK